MWEWGYLIALMIGLLFVDLKRSNSTTEPPTLASAIKWSIFWSLLGVAFSGWIYLTKGSASFYEYLSVFSIEKGLSLDNLLIFYLIFQAFNIPERLQHRTLFWGIVGAMVLRLILILLGTSARQAFPLMDVVLGAILLYTALQMLMHENDLKEKIQSLTKRLSRYLPIQFEVDHDYFLVKHKGRWMGTRLLLTLILIAVFDLIFAIDSIPAAFALSQDPLIIFTANVFAILGLRMLYFCLARLLKFIPKLRIPLALVLVVISLKLMFHHT